MKPKNKNPPKDQKPSQNRANQHARKNQRNQKKNQKKTAAKRSKKKATPLTPEKKEYRVQKKLRAPTQVKVRKLILAFPTYVSPHHRQADRIAGSERQFDKVPNWRGFQDFGPPTEVGGFGGCGLTAANGLAA